MMKRIVSGILLMLCTLSLTAGPAYPGRIIYTQPDGSTIGIYLHGDEFGHWATDDAGRLLEQDADGYWRISLGVTSRMLEEIREEAATRRAAANEVRREYAAQYAASNFGSPKIPVILVGFSGEGEGFSKTAAEFDAMLNSPGYRENNAIGSVWDYFNENSHGQFTPQFVVLGPVILDNPKSYYGASSGSSHDARPEMALVHAAKKLDSTVDFSQFDNDRDGTVDFVMFYFAGYDEAQGGGTDCIWSHAWYLSSSSEARNQRTFDNVRLDRYFCTAELKGNSGSTMCSIGTTCHEFSHTLGLPDFYDTDYEDNGTAASMYAFDLMSSGNYNGNSTMPPYFTAEELNEVGWLSAIPEMPTTGSVTLPAVNHPDATTYSAYMTKADVDGEYFVYEVRGGQRWDAPLPEGMMVYHVDKSSNRVNGYTSASRLWSSNDVNCYATHPCCYVVPAVAPTQTEVYSGPQGNFFFPGTGLVRSYSPTAWSGNGIGYQLTDIAYANRTVTFNLSNSNMTGISGTVMDTDGRPLEGVTVSITAESAAVATLATDADGYYSTALNAGTYQVTAAKEGYVSQSVSMTVTSRMETQNFYLMREGETAPSVLYAWPTDIQLERRIIGYSSNSIMAQNLYPSSQIARYAGKQIKEMKFFLYGDGNTSYEGVIVVIDYGNDRKATVSVNAGDLNVGDYTTVDLRDEELLIPASKDVYAGVGFSRGGDYDTGYYFAFRYYPTSGQDWAANWPFAGFRASYNLTATGTRTDAKGIFDFTLTIGDYEAPDTGYNYIADPGQGRYRAGDVLELALVETPGVRKPGTDVAWYLDENPVPGTSVTLSAGEHLVEARFTTTEGKTKVVELILTAE